MAVFEKDAIIKIVLEFIIKILTEIVKKIGANANG